MADEDNVKETFNKFKQVESTDTKIRGDALALGSAQGGTLAEIYSRTNRKSEPRRKDDGISGSRYAYIFASKKLKNGLASIQDSNVVDVISTVGGTGTHTAYIHYGIAAGGTGITSGKQADSLDVSKLQRFYEFIDGASDSPSSIKAGQTVEVEMRGVNHGVVKKFVEQTTVQYGPRPVYGAGGNFGPGERGGVGVISSAKKSDNMEDTKTGFYITHVRPKSRINAIVCHTPGLSHPDHETGLRVMHNIFQRYGFGYHYLIMRDGVIYNSGPDTHAHIHAVGQNINGLGLEIEAHWYIGAGGKRRSDGFSTNGGPTTENFVLTPQLERLLKSVHGYGYDSTAKQMMPNFPLNPYGQVISEQRYHGVGGNRINRCQLLPTRAQAESAWAVVYNKVREYPKMGDLNNPMSVFPQVSQHNGKYYYSFLAGRHDRGHARFRPNHNAPGVFSHGSYENKSDGFILILYCALRAFGLVPSAAFDWMFTVMSHNQPPDAIRRGPSKMGTSYKDLRGKTRIPGIPLAWKTNNALGQRGWDMTPALAGASMQYSAPSEHIFSSVQPFAPPRGRTYLCGHKGMNFKGVDVTHEGQPSPRDCRGTDLKNRVACKNECKKRLGKDWNNKSLKNDCIKNCVASK